MSVANGSGRGTELLASDIWSTDRLDRAFRTALRLGLIAAEAVNSARIGYDTALVQTLQEDLLSGTYRPFLQTGAEEAARLYVVAATVADVLSTQYPAPPPLCPSPGAWIANAACNGLTVANAWDLSDGFASTIHFHSLIACCEEIAGQRFAATVSAVIKALRGDRPTLSVFFSDAIYSGLDAILLQAVSLGHDRKSRADHLMAARVGHEVVVMANTSREYDWLLPATLRRVYTELERISFDLVAAPSQSLALTEGDTLWAFGYRVEKVRSLRRGFRFRYEFVAVPCRDEQLKRPLSKPAAPAEVYKSLLLERTPHEPHLKPQCRGVAGQSEAGNADVSSTAHWMSDRLKRVVAAVLHPAATVALRLHSIQVDAKTFGVAFAAIQFRVAALRVQRIAILPTLFLMVAVGLLGVAASDAYSGLSGETAILGPMPGFHKGLFNQGTFFEPNPIDYGLYLPPRQSTVDGQRPLIVFLHGYLPTERTLDRVLKVGLPRSIEKLAAGTGQGFPFVVLFPLDLENAGTWESGSPAVDQLPEVLDYVIRRHDIDPDRVYLTGLSNGAGAAWRLAEQRPDLWAAIASVSSPYAPDASRVKGIPSWIFEGGNDNLGGKEFESALRKVGGDVRLTVYPDRGHDVWKEAYDSRGLYEWLSSRRRGR